MFVGLAACPGIHACRGGHTKSGRPDHCGKTNLHAYNSQTDAIGPPLGLPSDFRSCARATSGESHGKSREVQF